MKTDRRSFLRLSGAAGASALAMGNDSIELVAQASRALGNRTPDDPVLGPFVTATQLTTGES